MNLPVKYIDLPRQFQDETLWALIKEQLVTCQFIMGPEVQKFEAHFAELCQTPFALGVNSGTDALFLALKVLGIGPGDEVITAPNSFLATTGAILAAGAKPVFVDVGDDYNINTDLLEPAISPRTRAILPVHLTGNPADMVRIGEIAKRHNLSVIEDAAQAIMAAIQGRRVGSWGDIGCFSLHPLKNLNVCGDGGVLTIRSQETYERLKLMRNHGLKNRDEIEFFAYNSRLDTLQATIADYGMKHLPAITRQRIRNATQYDQGLKGLEDWVIAPPRRDDVEQVFHTYVVQVKNREKLIAYLQENQVETKIHYPIPIHLQKPCKVFGYKNGDFPSCEKQAQAILSLPVHQHLVLEQIDYVIDLIKKFYKNQ